MLLLTLGVGVLIVIAGVALVCLPGFGTFAYRLLGVKRMLPIAMFVNRHLIVSYRIVSCRVVVVAHHLADRTVFIPIHDRRISPVRPPARSPSDRSFRSVWCDVM